MSKLELKAGARLTSAVSDATVMAIKIPAGEYDITCGGAPMVAAGGTAPEGASLADGDSGELQMGKRYVDEGETVEFLCTKAGAGTLVLNGEALDVKQAKQLPSSD